MPFSRFLPLQMTARQAQNLMEPVGKALAEQEEKVLKALFEQAAQKHTSQQEQQELLALKSIERLYIEMDGIMERLRRGSIEMEEKEQKRKGDVYREIKVGVIFEAERGRERSELAPEVWVDTPKQNSMRYVARRTAKGDFDQLLYGWACQSGLQQAQQVVILGDGALWIWKQAEEHFAGAVQIVDLYHAQEHVWQVARAVYGPQTEAAELWAKGACDLLVHGHIEKLVAAITALPQILERVAVCLRKPSTTLPLMPSGGGIRRFEHRGCMWAVASLKRLVKLWWRLASSARVCAGLLAAWMLFCLCARAFSTAPTTTSGRANLVWLLRHPQLISTHGTSAGAIVVSTEISMR